MDFPSPSSDERFRLLEFILGHASEGILIVGQEGRLHYVSESACQALGYSGEQLLTLQIFDVDPFFKKAGFSDFWERMRREKVLKTESVQLTHRGTAIPSEITVKLLPFGTREWMVVFFRDISDRKEEEHLKNISLTIFQSVNRSAGLDQLIFAVRDALGNILDATSLKVLLIHPLTNRPDQFSFKEGKIVVTHAKIEGTLAGWMLTSKQPALLNEDQIMRLERDGEIRPGKSKPKNWLGAPLFSGEQVTGIISLESNDKPDVFTLHHLEIIEFVCSQVSLSIQRRHSEEALRVSESNLRDSNAAKDKFFSIIAHDLRGPFNTIIGFSELLDQAYDTYTGSEKKRMIKHIHDTSVGTFNLLENLLEWSRIQTGRSKSNPQEVDLCTTIKSSLTFLQPQAKKKRITLRSSVLPGNMAFCDENMINTVIRNLISNAIKFTHQGGEIQITSAKKNHCIEISVADNGIGIRPENMSKIFRLSETFKTEGTEGEKGSGLGLLLCKEFIELNGGEIRAESTYGKGSRIIFTLPQTKEPCIPVTSGL